MILRVLIAGLAVMTAAPASAFQSATPSSPSEPAADALEAARQLLRSVNYNDQLAATARQSADASFEAVTRELAQHFQTEFPPELMAQFRTIMRENVEQLIADMQPTALEDAARVYARYFTAAEIMELQRLQSHPVLVKMQRIAPQFTADLARIGIEASARRMPQIVERMRAVVEEWQRHSEAQP
jgi:hypothetical protein